jgi:hypothetical protein
MGCDGKLGYNTQHDEDKGNPYPSKTNDMFHILNDARAPFLIGTDFIGCDYKNNSPICQ